MTTLNQQSITSVYQKKTYQKIYQDLVKDIDIILDDNEIKVNDNSNEIKTKNWHKTIGIGLAAENANLKMSGFEYRFKHSLIDDYLYLIDRSGNEYLPFNI